MILHNALKSEWNAEKGTGKYGRAAIQKDGFLHCATDETFMKFVREKLVGQEADKVMLTIDPAKLKSELKWEVGRRATFPHIYGLLNVDAVTRVEELREYIARMEKKNQSVSESQQNDAIGI